MDAQTNAVIAKLVEGRRIRMGMSRAELAQASGVRSSTLDRMVREHAGCSAADLWRIAFVLDVSIEDLCPAAPASPTAAQRAAEEHSFAPSDWIRPSDPRKPLN